MFRVTVELPAGYVGGEKEKKDIAQKIWSGFCDLYGQNGAIVPDVVCRFSKVSPDSSDVRACNADVIVTVRCIEGDIGATEQRLKITDCLKEAVFAKTSVPKEKMAVFLIEIPVDKLSIDGVLVCDSK